MPERPGWWPPNPHQNPFAGYRQLREHDAMTWESGAKAGVKAVIERMEILCYAMDANTTWCMASADWLQLRKEAGLE